MPIIRRATIQPQLELNRLRAQLEKASLHVLQLGDFMQITLELVEDEARLVERLLRANLSKLVSEAHPQGRVTINQEAKRTAAVKNLAILSGFLTKWNFTLAKFRT